MRRFSSSDSGASGGRLRQWLRQVTIVALVTSVALSGVGPFVGGYAYSMEASAAKTTFAESDFTEYAEGTDAPGPWDAGIIDSSRLFLSGTGDEAQHTEADINFTEFGFNTTVEAEGSPVIEIEDSGGVADYAFELGTIFGQPQLQLTGNDVPTTELWLSGYSDGDTVEIFARRYSNDTLWFGAVVDGGVTNSTLVSVSSSSEIEGSLNFGTTASGEDLYVDRYKLGSIDDFQPEPTGPPTYKQTYILEDRSGRFPADRTTLTVSKWYDANNDEYPSESEEWNAGTTTGFNAQNETSVRLQDGEYYKLTVVSPRGDTWELIGVQADKDTPRTDLAIYPADLGPATPTATPTRTPGVTPFPTPSPTATPGQTPFPTPTPMSGFGPTALGYCDVPHADDRGLEIEYWDPDRETTAFNYQLIGPENQTVYSGTKEFEEPVGYYRGCIAPSTLNESLNGTDPGDVDGTYNGSLEDGTSFNGSLSFPEPSFGGGGFGGPVGGGPGGASQATTWGGWLLLAAGGYVAYRRFGDGQVGAAISSASQQVTSLIGR